MQRCHEVDCLFPYSPYLLRTTTTSLDLLTSTLLVGGFTPSPRGVLETELKLYRRSCAIQGPTSGNVASGYARSPRGGLVARYLRGAITCASKSAEVRNNHSRLVEIVMARSPQG